ncbi:hypothetical protein C8Q80DRAFT_1094003 [Daedaleopsis nitida]|nr:hypothetical protein C8Q80DRAFT_1094003 [Daedaleopsis nitida]
MQSDNRWHVHHPLNAPAYSSTSSPAEVSAAVASDIPHLFTDSLASVHREVPTHSLRSRNVPPSVSPYPPPSSEPQQYGQLTTFKRRNAQISSAAVGTSARPSAQKKRSWKCPFCPHVQRNQRGPDLKRHIETHTPPEEGVRWVCCGVPYIQASALGVPDEVAREEPFEFAGTYMVGGCRKTFSRRDALSRHLRNTKGECYGDAFATYQPGNMTVTST